MADRAHGFRRSNNCTLQICSKKCDTEMLMLGYFFLSCVTKMADGARGLRRSCMRLRAVQCSLARNRLSFEGIAFLGQTSWEMDASACCKGFAFKSLAACCPEAMWFRLC